MFVNTQQVQVGIANFIENEIAKKAVGANNFIVYFALPIINKKVTQTKIKTSALFIINMKNSRLCPEAGE